MKTIEICATKVNSRKKEKKRRARPIGILAVEVNGFWKNHLGFRRFKDKENNVQIAQASNLSAHKVLVLNLDTETMTASLQEFI